MSQEGAAELSCCNLTVLLDSTSEAQYSHGVALAQSASREKRRMNCDRLTYELIQCSQVLLPMTQLNHSTCSARFSHDATAHLDTSCKPRSGEEDFFCLEASKKAERHFRSSKPAFPVHSLVSSPPSCFRSHRRALLLLLVSRLPCRYCCAGCVLSSRFIATTS